ncbi:MAG: signal peptidase I [Gammaproteobacteria bacterium]|nr:signal peptidase I [Gammaproteobacteria bacterium]
MAFDFQTVMFFALVISGAIWAVDAFVFAPKRCLNESDADDSASSHVDPSDAKQDINVRPKEPLLVEYARTFFPVILIVLLLRSFLVEPFRIPSGSMMPTLFDGDFILVNKYIYGIRLPVINKKIIDVSEPKRGDVVVFRYPKNPSQDYIKRMVGLPGDRIAYYNKTLSVNGKVVAQRVLGRYVGVEAAASMSGASHRIERLGDVEHGLLIWPERPTYEGEIEVPEGHYFVMGDNRDNSNDSRVWGFVPEENLVGRAFMVWLSVNSTASGIAWDRIGLSIE